MKKWLELAKKEITTGRVFKYFSVKRKSPQSPIEAEFDVIACPHAVMVIATDKKGKYICVRQYRHGSDLISVEFPAGSIDRGEDALVAAKRELLEETGHESKDWEYLGRTYFNPALLTNWLDIYIAKDCEKVAELSLDPLEEIELEYLDMPQIENYIGTGDIHHSSILAGLYLLNSKQKA